MAQIDRRSLLAWSASLGSLGLTGCLRAGRLRPTTLAEVALGGGRSFTASEWASIAAVQETLWPPGQGVPSTHEFNATGFLDAALLDPEVPPTDLFVVRDGLALLDVAARLRGVASFAALAPTDREAVLTAFQATEPGAPWVRLVLRYTMEALLGDPIHGGNPGGVGWRWVGVESGEPRPAGAPPVDGA